MTRVVIVGGGIAGLALAYRLEHALPGATISLLEQQTRLGGVIDTLEQDGFTLEVGPNGFPDANPVTLDLARSLGIEGELVPASDEAGKNRFLLLEGRLRRLPSGLGSLLSSNLLSWGAKFRLLTERFRAPRRGTEDESVASFLRRRVGAELASTFGDAFVTGVYAGDPDLLSAPATFPRLVGFEREHGSLMRGMAAARKKRQAESAAPPPGALGRLKAFLGLSRAPARAGRMWSFRSGLRTLIVGLVARLRTRPVLGVAVKEVRRGPAGWVVRGEGRDSWEAEAVVLCCPAYRQAEILDGLDAPLAQQVGAIPYNRIAVVAVGYRAEDVPHRLDGFGYLSPQKSGREVLGMQWCSSIFPGRAPPGCVLMRALCGGWRRGEVVDWPDDRLLEVVRGELALALGVRAEPVFHRVVRWHRAIPQYHLGHLERVAWIEEQLKAHPGLFLGGSAYRGVAINDCVEQAGKLAERVVRWARQ